MDTPEPIFFFLVIGSILTTFWMLRKARRLSETDLGHFGQGLLGIASVLALMVGLIAYYLEGRSKVRVDSSTAATIVPLEPGPEGGRVLVQMVGTVTNRGFFPTTFECVAIDVRGFRPVLSRNRRFVWDLDTEPLMEGTAGGARWDSCLKEEQRRWEAQEARRLREPGMAGESRRPFIRTNSGIRYDTYDLLPGESRTHDVEVVVPCVYAAVRVHFVVPKPGTDAYQDLKKVHSIRDECRISRRLRDIAARRRNATRSSPVRRGSSG